jgi:NTP pyrophosphatase (non-canonical NTP hydrolase)
MADVLAYLLRLASILEIDLPQAFEAKMLKNAIKYPTDPTSNP